LLRNIIRKRFTNHVSEIISRIFCNCDDSEVDVALLTASYKQRNLLTYLLHKDEVVIQQMYNYTVSQKNCATFLRPITLDILNRSLQNLAKIKVSSL